MSANHETHGRSRNDLEWLAFQYVAGELPVEDEEQFETRLTTESEVAEAVARAVELGETASLAFAAVSDESTRDHKTIRPEPVSSRSSTSLPTPGRAVSVLVAAGVIVAALLISFRADDARNRVPRSEALLSSADSSTDFLRPGTSTSEVSSLLLQTWTDARESIAALDGDAATEVAVTDLSESRTDLAGDVPDWMFVAVELSCGSDPGNPNRTVLEN